MIYNERKNTIQNETEREKRNCSNASLVVAEEKSNFQIEFSRRKLDEIKKKLNRNWKNLYDLSKFK